MSSDMRKAAEFAEQLADAGYDVWTIVRELHQAADAEEFGWTGAKHFGTTAGVVPVPEVDALYDRVADLIDADRKKTVTKDDLREALNSDG